MQAGSCPARLARAHCQSVIQPCPGDTACGQWGYRGEPPARLCAPSWCHRAGSRPEPWQGPHRPHPHVLPVPVLPAQGHPGWGVQAAPGPGTASGGAPAPSAGGGDAQGLRAAPCCPISRAHHGTRVPPVPRGGASCPRLLGARRSHRPHAGWMLGRGAGSPGPPRQHPGSWSCCGAPGPGAARGRQRLPRRHLPLLRGQAEPPRDGPAFSTLRQLRFLGHFVGLLRAGPGGTASPVGLGELEHLGEHQERGYGAGKWHRSGRLAVIPCWGHRSHSRGASGPGAGLGWLRPHLTVTARGSRGGLGEGWQGAREAPRRAWGRCDP